MKITDMLAMYGPGHKDWTFDSMYWHGLSLQNLDPINIKYFPFLKQNIWEYSEGLCILQQLVAIEKGLA